MVAKAQGPFVGKALTAREFVVDDALMKCFHRGLALPWDGGGAVPSVIASGVDNAYFDEIAFPDHFGHLWMRQEYEFRGPLVAGGRYVAKGRIRDIYARRDRKVVCYEVEVWDGDRVLQRSRHHQSFLAERHPAAELKLRAAKDKPGARRFEVPPGAPFGGLTRTITVAMCGEFFHGDANYHTDREASAALGFRDVVVGGRMTMALAAHVCEEAFGRQWWRSGRLDVKFTNPVWPDDAVTARGVMTEAAAGRRAAFVWLAKADGTVALVAQASAGA